MRCASVVARGHLAKLVLLVTLALMFLHQLIVWELDEVVLKDLNNMPSDALTRSNALKQHVKDVCKNLSFLSSKIGMATRFMHYDDRRKVIYCFIPKVASTSWKRVWLKMTGKIKPKSYENGTSVNRYVVHTGLPLLAHDWRWEHKLKTYKKFMLVRHPFERVLSAYRDKLENEDKQSTYNFHREIGKKIQMKYRDTPDEEGHNVTFSEFIRFISEPGHGTFEQQNEHWLPMHKICNPCAVQYDFIGKYENLKEDADYLLKWLRAAELVSEFPSSDRPFHASHHVAKYQEQLTKEEVTAFNLKYFPDFHIFNYKLI